MGSDRERTIIDIAQSMIREGGYNNFSFRNIAAAIGIKSSSVHYHFATKEDLGAAVARCYTDQFIDSLGDPKELHDLGQDPISIYVAAFRKALEEDKLMCLCGMLGAEIEVLPTQVLLETRRFFQQNISWLEAAYSVSGSIAEAKIRATQTIATLEGAMIVSKAMDDLSLFDQAVENIQ